MGSIIEKKIAKKSRDTATLTFRLNKYFTVIVWQLRMLVNTLACNNILYLITKQLPRKQFFLHFSLVGSGSVFQVGSGGGKPASGYTATDKKDSKINSHMLKDTKLHLFCKKLSQDLWMEYDDDLQLRLSSIYIDHGEWPPGAGRGRVPPLLPPAPPEAGPQRAL